MTVKHIFLKTDGYQKISIKDYQDDSIVYFTGLCDDIPFRIMDYEVEDISVNPIATLVLKVSKM